LQSAVYLTAVKLLNHRNWREAMRDALMRNEMPAGATFVDPGSKLERVEKKIGYVQAVRVGKTLYISGSVRWQQQGGEFAAEEMRAQMRHAFGDIRQMLFVHGATVNDIVKETVYTKNIETAMEAEAIRKELYGDHSPTARWVGVSRLLYPELLVEIGIVAKLP
jgi:2-iminobutanoate/2-iminopropanoate deaminase